MPEIPEPSVEPVRQHAHPADEQANEHAAARSGDTGELRRMLGEAQATIARVDALHQPRPARQWKPCQLHTGARVPDLDACPDCTSTPITVCSRITCCGWPCDEHLALHNETEETCVHVR
jgi:hypothetical protein